MGSALVAFLLFGGLGLALAFAFREPDERSKKTQRDSTEGEAEQSRQDQDEAGSTAEHNWQQQWSDKPHADFNAELDLKRRAEKAQQRAAEQAQFQRAREGAEQRERQRRARAKLEAEKPRVYTVEECRRQVQKHHPDKGGSREQFELWMSRLDSAREE